MNEKKMPVGIQSFEKIRSDDYLYVDKTRYIYDLVHAGIPYFLSRPRRFGKSLLLSTLKAYWEGKKELFSGLEIEKLEKDNPAAWKPYPVFYFDFNGTNYQNEDALEEILDEQLRRLEADYDITGANGSLGERFRNLIIKCSKDTGRRAVILVDEYDKPLLDVIDNPELQNHNKDIFKGFFSTLKSFDDHIQFVFITGVSKFHKVSIFSDLNQLTDISMTKAYAGVCGITEEELQTYFTASIADLAAEQNLTYEECLNELRQNYDGYRFHPAAEGVYNPFSLLNAFFNKEFGSFWFETGSPTFLVKELRHDLFDVRRFTDKTIYASEALLRDYTGDLTDPIPLLYQTGYLTIVDFNAKQRRYTLCFPNEEVKYGFLESMMPSYVPKSTASNGLDIFSLSNYIEEGDTDSVRNYLAAMFANITYTLKTDPFEHYFQAVIYLIFTLLGKITVCEMHTFSGRIDCRVETGNFIYLFEFKRDDTAESALQQIDTKEYSLPFVADSRKLIKIGVSFDSVARKLVGWEVSE